MSRDRHTLRTPALGGAEELAGRSVVAARTPFLEPCTVVIARHGIGRASRVVISWHGSMQISAVLTMEQAADVVAAIEKAQAISG